METKKIEPDKKKSTENTETSNTPPKLGVYTSTDGSAYSKPDEVKAMFQWIKSKSQEKSKSLNK